MRPVTNKSIQEQQVSTEYPRHIGTRIRVRSTSLRPSYGKIRVKRPNNVARVNIERKGKPPKLYTILWYISHIYVVIDVELKIRIYVENVKIPKCQIV